MADFNEAIRLDPDNSEAYYSGGNVLWYPGEFKLHTPTLMKRFASIQAIPMPICYGGCALCAG